MGILKFENGFVVLRFSILALSDTVLICRHTALHTVPIENKLAARWSGVNLIPHAHSTFSFSDFEYVDGTVIEPKENPDLHSYPIFSALRDYTSLYRPSMALLDLASELLLCISENLELERDINAFTRTNHHLYNLLNPYLYRHDIRLFRSSALRWAAEHGQEGTARKMLREGADTENTTEDGHTPLVLAAMNGHKTLIELLLAEGGLNPDSEGCLGRTPLSRAAEMGNEVVVKLLLSKDDVDPDSVDYRVRRPLSWAVTEQER
jgi:Ankyrin repeats (3 copies)